MSCLITTATFPHTICKRLVSRHWSWHLLPLRDILMNCAGCKAVTKVKPKSKIRRTHKASLKASLQADYKPARLAR